MFGLHLVPAGFCKFIQQPVTVSEFGLSLKKLRLNNVHNVF